MNLIMWLFVGVIAGRVASLLMGTREGLMLNIIVSIMGAFIAGLVVTPLLVSTINQNSFSLPAVLVSMGGAVILLTVLSLFRQRGYRLR